MENVPKNTIAIMPTRSAPTLNRRRDEIDPRIWERPDMRRLLATRDIAGVYRRLQRHGLSQRAIAARVGQSQSEISEILTGAREVTSYDLFVRICEGLGVPRGWMGLAYDGDLVDQDERRGGGQ